MAKTPWNINIYVYGQSLIVSRFHFTHASTKVKSSLPPSSADSILHQEKPECNPENSFAMLQKESKNKFTIRKQKYPTQNVTFSPHYLMPYWKLLLYQRKMTTHKMLNQTFSQLTREICSRLNTGFPSLIGQGRPQFKLLLHRLMKTRMKNNKNKSVFLFLFSENNQIINFGNKLEEKWIYKFRRPS